MASPTQALFFDVFGTVVDWRTSIAREAVAILKPLGHDIDGLAFADAWRGEYQGVFGEIKGAAVEAKTFVANAQGIADQVKAGKGALGALVFDENTANNFKTSVQNLRDVSDKIAKGEGTLGKLINDDTLFRDVQGTLKKADRALDGLDDAGPINAVGVVAKSLF